MPQFSAGGGSPGEVVVADIRSIAAAGAPAGLQVHLTGEMATQVDNATSSGSSQDRTQNLSLLFIIVLLLLAFRAVPRRSSPSSRRSSCSCCRGQ